MNTPTGGPTNQGSNTGAGGTMGGSDTGAVRQGRSSGDTAAKDTPEPRDEEDAEKLDDGSEEV